MSAKKEYDVVVIGGGTAGCSAAIASALKGASTLVVEREGFLGGTVTSQPLEAMMTFHDRGGQVIDGVPQMIVDRLVAAGGSEGHVPDDTAYCSTITPYNNEIMKSVIASMFEELGIDVLMNSTLVGLDVDDEKITSARVRTPFQEILVAAREFVDTSGNGVTFELARVQCVVGDEQTHKMQPASLLYKLINVDVESFRNYLVENIELFRYFTTREVVLDRLRSGMRYSHVWGFGEIYARARSRAQLGFKKDEVQILLDSQEKTAIINGTRADGVNALNETDVQRAYYELRKQVLQSFQTMRDQVPGFENSSIGTIGATLGVRETRHLVGEYVVREEDIVGGRTFDDTIAYCAFPIDIHQPTGTSIDSNVYSKRFGIPFRSLVPKTIGNLIVGGRCLSSDHRALGALRSTVTCMATGQVCGIAAAISALRGQMVKHVSIEHLRRELKAIGAIC